MADPVTFDAEELMRRARAQTGLDDFGDTPFEEALERLCRSVREDVPRTPEAIALIEGHVIKYLCDRLRMTADRATYPEIAQQTIRAPLVIIGLPRSGTTILHSILSCDPAAHSPLRWLLTYPSPPPRAETFETDPRIARVEAEVEQMDAGFRAMHRMGAQLPEECNTIQQASFLSVNYPAYIPMPSYSNWLLNEADMTPAYAFGKEFLQHLQAFVRRDYWVLKGPPHLHWVDVLLRTFPDARIVMTHRDPGQVIGSITSMICHLLRSASSIDPTAIGADQMASWSLAIERTMAFRRSWNAPEQFVDVQYDDLLTDPLSVVQTIYDHFGMELTEETRERMRRFIADNAQEKHGKHVYDLRDYGMDPVQVREAMSDYIKTYKVPLKALS
ncbi:MAG TPA: sulfotransferase [Novosphingobium sp.]|nr:sulfotransferase [Novosphingobium sp.]